MSTIPLGLGDWGSVSQNRTRLKLHNMYVVPNPSSPDEVSRVSRPTLSLAYTVGTGPVQAMWYQPNVVNGDLLILSGTTLYRINSVKAQTIVGVVPGSGKAIIAGTRNTDDTDSLFIVRDKKLYYSNGVTVSLVNVPDNQPVSSVATINGYFIVSIAGSQKFYWIMPSRTTIDPLNFASAERIPDPIISVQVVSDEVWFLGLSGPEVWTPTGDANAPFLRVSGRVYKEGCYAADTVVSSAINGIPALLWVTDTKTVVKAQGQPVKISNESVEELLKTADDLSSWLFRYNRHDFYIITSSQFTVVYDISTNLWARWDTYLLPYWDVSTSAQIGTTVYVSSRDTGAIHTLTEGVADNALPVVRELSGFMPGSANPVGVSEVIAYVNSGWSASYALNPTLELRWSDNLGSTWSDYVEASLGDKGDYTRVVSYRNLGLLSSPGRIFEFRISDPVRFRFDYATVNEKQGM